MYNKIPAEIKPSEASAQISYAGAFDPDFCLLLRERRATSLAQMQDADVEVESNVLAADRLRSKTDADRRKGRFEVSTSGSPVPHPQVDELTKMVKYLFVDMEKMKFERKKSYKSTQNTENRGNFRRPNNTPWILPRDPRSRDRGDQKIQTLLQNNLVVDVEGEEEEIEPEIHFLGDTSLFPHLTQYAYDESVTDNQIHELSKGEKTNNIPIKYNLRSKKKEGNYDVPDHPSRPEKPAKDATSISKEKKTQNPLPLAKGLVLEVK
jgi:hypothetical protein